MKYTVIWVPTAEQELAALWMDATNREAVTRASHAIDRLLGRDPLGEGESRPGGGRVLLMPPWGCSTRFPRTTASSASCTSGPSAPRR